MNTLVPQNFISRYHDSDTYMIRLSIAGLATHNVFAACISFSSESTVKYKINDIFKEVR